MFQSVWIVLDGVVDQRDVSARYEAAAETDDNFIQEYRLVRRRKRDQRESAPSDEGANADRSFTAPQVGDVPSW